jgi:Cys-rich protein (TIGR01571 family)
VQGVATEKAQSVMAHAPIAHPNMTEIQDKETAVPVKAITVKSGPLTDGKLGTKVEVSNVYAKNYIAVVTGVVSTGDSARYLVQFIGGDKDLRAASATYPFELVDGENLRAVSAASSGESRRSQWKVGLFDVTAEPGGVRLCLMSWCCPCIVFGQTMEKLSPAEFTCGGSKLGACCYFLACGPCATIPARNTLRRKYDIPGSLPMDCLVHHYCSCCALIQVRAHRP